MNADEIKMTLKNFLDNSDRLKAYPAKFKLKVCAWFYLAAKFERGRRYTEKEVNAILNEWHTFNDWALLRRMLYDGRFFNRMSDCSYYWLEENQPTLNDFNLS